MFDLTVTDKGPQILNASTLKALKESLTRLIEDLDIVQHSVTERDIRIAFRDILEKHGLD